MSLAVKCGFLLLVFGVAVGHKHMTRDGWIAAIEESFRAHISAYEARDIYGIVAGMSKDIHRLPPGRTTEIGLSDVMASYQNIFELGFWPTFLYTRLTELRIYNDVSAVAEWKSAVNSTSGTVKEVKGVGVYVMEGGAVKLFTHIYNSEP